MILLNQFRLHHRKIVVAKEPVGSLGSLVLSRNEKTELRKNLKLEFAEDVRLTFANAMKYNTPGNDVHFMAFSLIKPEVKRKSTEGAFRRINELEQDCHEFLNQSLLINYAKKQVTNRIELML